MNGVGAVCEFGGLDAALAGVVGADVEAAGASCISISSRNWKWFEETYVRTSVHFEQRHP